ncbi:unnamed protein product [Pieris macdunnoughi]|uniref:Uncharacterized protein n=1 Tax=Pieris macdunnoughi TaxID=345717 RepID=A0A821WGH6_9NEOP|nr:unnamed protein product [Pieris macdunnoughi]
MFQKPEISKVVIRKPGTRHPLILKGGYPPQGGYPPGGYPPKPGFLAAGYDGVGYGEPGYGGPAGLGKDADVKGFNFNEQTIREAFVRKVYSILTCQLLLTLSFITLFVYHTPTKLWAEQNTWTFWVAFVMMFVCLIAMSFCGDLRRQSPTNFIFIGLFILAESFLLGVTSSVYKSDAAVGITAAICLALTILAMQTKWVSTAIISVMVTCCKPFNRDFIPRNSIVTLVYASVGALLFSVYLIYDTQLMMGGKHKYSISPEKYVFAALNLYLDVINIFIHIFMIIGVAKD